MTRRPSPPQSTLPSDPILALRANELLARGRQLESQGKIADAARVSAELVNVAPDLAEAHQFMGSMAMRTGAADIAAMSFERALQLKPRSADLHIALAQALLALQRPADAARILDKGRTLHPNDAGIFRELGQAQLDLGQPDAALKSFSRATKLVPNDLYSRHMASALATTGAPNPGYVAELFDSYAGTFDAHLTGKLEYRVPQALAAALAEHGPVAGPTLDVGCGTGLVATTLPETLRPIDGIDISEKMIAKAQERGVYRHLRTGDAHAVLADEPDFAGPYGLIVAADVFIYIGDIGDLFASLAARLAPGGILAFSIEFNEAQGIAIRSSGRFSHSPAYIHGLAAANDLSILAEVSHPIRLEREIPIPGRLFLLRRG
ncbi:tetratricopeptide repeat protein [Devosia riboflavina]|uniref:tetratricopeptide repeat protein n=1 Tax=Devosia riboflavina TaxID=46914 RepID=UPI000691D28C|nr:tetratricopeptide repeat protein [Devosia riboflavina]